MIGPKNQKEGLKRISYNSFLKKGPIWKVLRRERIGS